MNIVTTAPETRPGVVRRLALGHLINARSANVGNGALTESVESLLQEDVGCEISFRREAWDDYTFGVKPFDKLFVDVINDADGMIVGGAVAMNARPYYANAGMRFDLPRELWSAIRKPIVFYGLSHRHWRGEIYHHSEKLRWTVKHILDQPQMLLALRNDGTREWLAETIGIEDTRIRIVPDPGVFVVADRNVHCHDLDPHRRNVLLAFNDEDWDRRYQDSARRLAVIEAMVRPIERMIERFDVNLVIVPHYFDDFRMAIDFVDRCQPKLAHQHMIASGLSGLRGSREFYGRYAQADLVISMRVHSMSPAIGLGVPMIPIVTQDRMTMFLEDVGLGDLALDAFAPDLADRLEAAIESALSDPQALSRRFIDARAGMRARARAFNCEVAELFNAG